MPPNGAIKIDSGVEEPQRPDLAGAKQSDGNKESKRLDTDHLSGWVIWCVTECKAPLNLSLKAARQNHGGNSEHGNTLGLD
ncbi:hypothetical protein DPMN_012870 [Dreissena polymorpha]|uniref:Uncharacterized protein n=1 Tax=Dreissena polymorpha TaxID=45954 RepID=A0A9D4N496_DREPO|nr:hypothetical protein DPMN_012870 [Dreissena polymorpha]